MKTATLGGLMTIGVVLLIAGGASAEPETHDGFQFRGAAGVGYLADSMSEDGTSDSIHGVAGSFEVFVGGMPIPGLAIGGFLNATVASGPSETISGGGLQVTGTADNDVSLNFITIGPYVDYYPDPTKGLHVLGAIGYAEANLSDGNGDSGNAATGFSIGAGVGYDWWVSNEWSLGILGRLTYGALTLKEDGASLSQHVVAPTVAFSFSYN